MKARLLAVMAVVAVGAMAGISPAVAQEGTGSADKRVPAVVKAKRSTSVTLQQCSGGTEGCGGWTLQAGTNPAIAKVSSVRSKKGAELGSTTTYYVKVTGVKKGKTSVTFSNPQGTTTIIIKVVR